MQAAEAVKAGSRQAAAGAAAGVEQLAAAAPQVAQQVVEGLLKPTAADMAAQLPAVVQQVGAELLEDEGGCGWVQKGVSRSCSKGGKAGGERGGSGEQIVTQYQVTCRHARQARLRHT